ncbi:hypothetical protein [Lactococcus allomyrinae]|uniref:Uncharacterized protein n=1 Tax=Lactococcus allomyrinae TaxID=2419773 RepID=A0A387BGP2_9LACT|nr:hypothetical protein [Lactococcus allomyrinae]AYG01322.1 hypothetical protein D7I46_09575 [Lactococcus allomyrinae]
MLYEFDKMMSEKELCLTLLDELANLQKRNGMVARIISKHHVKCSKEFEQKLQQLETIFQREDEEVEALMDDFLKLAFNALCVERNQK